MDDGRPILLATPAPVTHRTAEGNLGLACLAAVLRRAGRTVHIVDGWLEGLNADAISDRLASFGPALWVGFSCYRTNMGRAMETASSLRARGVNVPIVAGGYGPTFEPEVFLEAGFDVVAIGEAERTVLALTDLYAAGENDLRRVPGLVFRGPGGAVVRTGPPAALTVLDAAPPPERDTLELERARRSAAHVETSRGCRAGCTFCSIVAFARTNGTERWRQKPIERIVEEFSDLERRGARVVKVIDDSFIEPPRDLAWVQQLADAIERAGVRLLLRGSVRADRVDDAMVAA
jgi:anaerobic magnesium-protoporphyrin IX monomethyl ester cyclase